MLNKITIFALCLTCFAQAQEKSIIQIGGIAGKITKSTSCNRDAWGKSDENACRCCVTKHNYTGDSNQKTFAYCSQKVHCTEESLHNIAVKAGIPENPIDPDAFVPAVVKEAHLLPVVTLNEKELQKAGTAAGDLDETTAVYFLKVAAQKGFIPEYTEELVQGETCIQAFKKKASGDTRQLFAINIKPLCLPEAQRAGVTVLGKTIFYLKETSKPIEESINITHVRSDSRLEPYILGGESHPTDFALELTSYNLVYMFKDQPHFMSLLKSAPGKPISELIKAWYKENVIAVGNSNQTQEDVKRIDDRYKGLFCHAGKALAIFNRANMVPREGIFGTTIEHGALNADQYFIGEDPNHAGQTLATMIDNQTMAASLNQTKPISDDLLSLSASAAIAMMDATTNNKALAKQVWKEIFFTRFIECYIGNYPAHRRAEVVAKLKPILGSNGVWNQLKAQGRSSSEWSDVAKQMVGVIDEIR